MKYLCSYVLALANNIYRAEARHIADYKPAPNVADKLQYIVLPLYSSNVRLSCLTASVALEVCSKRVTNLEPTITPAV